MASLRSVSPAILLPALLCLLIQPATAAPPSDGDRPADPAVAPPENSQPIQGVIQDRDGKPLASVQVLLAPPRSAVEAMNGKVHEHSLRTLAHVETGDDGAFSFPPQKDPCTIIAMSDAGYGETSSKDLAERPQLTLQPWARIEGVARIGTRLAANVEVGAAPIRDNMPAYLDIRSAATTDAEGRFVLERVPPGRVHVHRIVRASPTMRVNVSRSVVDALPGQTINVQLGGVGRPLAGRIEIPEGAVPEGTTGQGHLAAKVDYPRFQPPPEYASMTPQQRQQWYREWLDTPEGKAFHEKQEAAARKSRFYALAIAPDGTFQIDEIEPGTYGLQASFTTPATKESPSEEVATAQTTFTVDPVPGGASDEPLQLPPIKAVILKLLRVGEEAPDFTARTLDGSSEVRLSDLRGKYVLLDFWATWCGPCLRETPNFKAAYEKFGRDERFAMVGLSIDDAAEAPLKYTRDNALNWNQWFLGASSSVLKDYGIRGIPSIWLIGPDGKVVAKNLRGDRIEQAVGEALNQQ